MFGVVDVRWYLLLSPSGVVFMCSLDSWMSEGQLLEWGLERYLFVPRLFSELFRSGYGTSELKSLWWRRFLATSVSFFPSSWVVWLVLLEDSLCLLCSSWWLTGVSGGCCQATWGIGDNPVVPVVSGLSRAVPEWRLGVLSLGLGPQPGHFQLCWSECLFVDIYFVQLVFCSQEPVCMLH